jgi:serine/threonine-protein kinase SRPK3
MASVNSAPRGKTADAIGNSLDNVKLGGKGAEGIKFGEKTIAPNKMSHGPSLLSQQLHHTPSGNLTPASQPSAPPSTVTAASTAATTPDVSESLPQASSSKTSPKAVQSGFPSSLGRPSEDLLSPPIIADVTSDGSSTSETSLPYNALQTGPPHGLGMSSQPAPAAGDPNTLPPPAPYDPISLERITVKIADLGNACWVDHHFTNDIQTRQYRCPEIILGTRWGPSADMWSAACLFFELLTGDYLFDPQPGAKYDKDDDHLAQIIELLGDMPKSFALSGKYSADLFNRRGELRHIHKLRYWPLVSVLSEKYLMEQSEAELLASFLLPMLDYSSENRAKPADLVKHKWLEGVIVQGEIDLMMEQAAREQESSESSDPSAPLTGSAAILSDPSTLKAQLGSMGRI